MNYYQLKYVIKAAEYKSISKAAEKLYISQAACSNAITSLEDELNIKIFNRTNKGVKLTPCGKAFISQAKIVLNQTEILESIKDNNSNDVLHLKISCHRIFFITSILAELYQNNINNGVKISLNEVPREQVLLDVMDGNYSLGLIALNNIELSFWNHMIEVNNLQYTELRNEQVYVYVSKNHPLANKEFVTSEDLKGYTTIYLPERNKFSKFYNVPTNEILLKGNKKAIYLNDKDTIIKFIRKTDAFVLAMNLPDSEFPEGLEAIPLKDDAFDFSIGWVKRKNEKLTKIEKDFLALV